MSQPTPTPALSAEERESLKSGIETYLSKVQAYGIDSEVVVKSGSLLSVFEGFQAAVEYGDVERERANAAEKELAEEKKATLKFIEDFGKSDDLLAKQLIEAQDDRTKQARAAYAWERGAKALGGANDLQFAQNGRDACEITSLKARVAELEDLATNWVPLEVETPDYPAYHIEFHCTDGSRKVGYYNCGCWVKGEMLGNVTHWRIYEGLPQSEVTDEI